MEKQKRKLTAQVSVYSPRWGHDDTHTLTMGEEKLHFSGNGPGANCSRDEDGNHEWSGYGDAPGENSLIAVLENDEVYPPSVLVDAIEWLWEDWISFEIKDDEVHAELKALFDWVNTCSHSKATTDYWSKKF